MLRSTRLVTIALSIATLCTLAPTAFASPNTTFGFDFDVKAEIEALFSTFENVFFGWTDTDYSGDPALQAQAESSNSYGSDPGESDGNDVDPNDGDVPQEQALPISDPNG